MEFGRITDPLILDRIEWNLPPLRSVEEERQLDRLRRAASRIEQKPKLHVGLPVWSEAKWVGSLYPPKTKTDSYLRAYANQFSTVEINSTFYAVPGIDTFRKWKQSVDADFRFCPKYPQSISRPLAHRLDTRELESFVVGVQELGENVGACFLQLPPEAGFSVLPRLEAFFAGVPDAIRARSHVEFRNPSFFEGPWLKPQVVDSLARLRVGTVITDTAMFREFVHGSLSATRVLLRFAASNGHASDLPRMDAWVERLSAWFAAGLKEAYVTVHATDVAAQVRLGRAFAQKLDSLGARVPEIHAEAQRSLFA